MKLKKNRKNRSRFDLSDVPPGAMLASLSADIMAHARMVKQGRDLALAIHALAKRDERYRTLVADLEAVLSEQNRPVEKSADD